VSRSNRPPHLIDDENLPTILCRFLLVSLNIEAILGEVTICQRRKKLEEMARGDGLSDAYTATITRLKAQKGNKSVLGFKVIMWVSHSQRPLRAEELCQALGVEVGSADLDPKNVPALRMLLASCLGLVTVEASSSTIRLVHFTLQEHLSSDPTLFRNPHSAIAEVCLTYLNFDSVRNLSPTLDSAPSTMRLLEYASYYWGKHAGMGMTEGVKMLALRLLEGFDKHISAQLLLLRYKNDGHWTPYFQVATGPTGFTGLHGVAFLGIGEIVPDVLEMKEWNVNATDCTGSMPLTWASINGCEEVVKILLEQGDIIPDQADLRYGRTPLSWGAEEGHEGVVRILLEREDVDPGRECIYCRTPLSLAAARGHAGLVEMLLEREDVDPDQADCYGQTPLSRAAARGHEVVVNMLLERGGVNPDQADQDGQTPLSWAAKSGHEGAVKILLEQENVNPNHADTSFRRTPLWLATENGHGGVVTALLERGEIDPNTRDTLDCQTPLSLAARNGIEEVIKVLLERADVDPNEAGRCVLTPLSWAAYNGHEGIVKILLEQENVNPDQAGCHGRTPLSWAAARGHEVMVKVLLEGGDVNPDQADSSGQTPLSWAARRGHEGVLKILLE